MRVRDHQNLQLLRIPLMSSVRNHPPLLPRPAVDVQELDLVIQILGGEVDGGLPGVPAGDGLRGGDGLAGVAIGDGA